MATAGLRMLSSTQSTAVLSSVQAQLSASGFQFHPAWAKILSGQLEGTYAWLAFNYAAGTLASAAKPPPPATRPQSAPPSGAGGSWGVIEMGGASTQITFMPADPWSLPADQLVTVNAAGASLKLYTHSFLGFGMDSAWFRAGLLVQQQQPQPAGATSSSSSSPSSPPSSSSPAAARIVDPCLPAGYTSSAGIKGSGSFDACARVAQQLLPSSNCSYSLCSIGGLYLPKMSGNQPNQHTYTHTFFMTLNFHLMRPRI